MKHIKRKKLIGFLIIAGLLWSSLAVFSDVDQIVSSVRSISVERMLVVLGLSGMNYWIRLIRFNWLTGRVAVKKIKKDLNSVIFFSGLSMNLTPARVGELVKAYFQQQLFGESFARMAPVVFIERLTDALAMLLMMSFGVLAFQLGRGIFVILVGVVAIIVTLLHHRESGKRIVGLIECFPGGKKMVMPAKRALAVSYRLTDWRPLTLSTGLGLMAWIIEAAGLWLLLGGVGVSLTLSTLYLTLFTFSAAAAAGFISVIPAGLGVNELSTIGLLERLMGVPLAMAVVVTFAFRLVTLWLGILLGMVSLVYLERKID